MFTPRRSSAQPRGDAYDQWGGEWRVHSAQAQSGPKNLLLIEVHCNTNQTIKNRGGPFQTQSWKLRDPYRTGLLSSSW